MADVQGRLSGTAGVCLSTLDAGPTNLITDLADVHLYHASLVAISGQVSLDRKWIESHQYVDRVSLFKPITKWNSEISLPQMIRYLTFVCLMKAREVVFVLRREKEDLQGHIASVLPADSSDCILDHSQ